MHHKTKTKALFSAMRLEKRAFYFGGEYVSLFVLALVNILKKVTKEMIL